MKKKSVHLPKLSLNKETISALNAGNVVGGIAETQIISRCASCFLTICDPSQCVPCGSAIPACGSVVTSPCVCI